MSWWLCICLSLAGCAVPPENAESAQSSSSGGAAAASADPSEATTSSAPGSTSGGSSSGEDGESSGSSGEPADELPTGLPFELDRPPDGEVPTPEEIEAFTRTMTGFWRDTDQFRWIASHSHGLPDHHDPAMPGYSLWWHDTVAQKSGSVVTFAHVGPADNLMIPTAKTLTQTAAGYLASGDPTMGDLVVGYSAGVRALFQGMVWGSERDPVDTIMARAIFTHNHLYETPHGNLAAVDYDPIKTPAYDWNGHTVPNPSNPTYGDIWVRNMRSKDDVPHMLRAVPILRRVAQDATDADVAAAAADAVAAMEGFAADIVEHNYRIRSKEDGEIFVPDEGLAIFVPAECAARLAIALVATGDPDGNDCGSAVEPLLETVAITINYFNAAILHYFHLAAITNALIERQDAIAEELLHGLIERADWVMDADDLRADFPAWDTDVAGLLLAGAASGLPLTGREAHHVQQHYAASAEYFAAWPNWDLWALPDGTHVVDPPRGAPEGVFIRIDEMAFLLHYCASPWRNPNSAEFVDCDIVNDPGAWGR